MHLHKHTAAGFTLFCSSQFVWFKKKNIIIIIIADLESNALICCSGASLDRVRDYDAELRWHRLLWNSQLSLHRCHGHTHTHTVKEQSAQYSLCVQQLQVQIRCSVQVLSPFSVVFGSAAAPNWLRHDELILFLTINPAGWCHRQPIRAYGGHTHTHTHGQRRRLCAAFFSPKPNLTL